MWNTRRIVNSLFVPTTLAAITAISVSTTSTSLLAQPSTEQRVEIVIRDYAFEVLRPAPIRPGLPTVMILHNQDIVKHGFTSQMLMGMLVHGEGEGVAAYGKGIEGFYINPSKTLVIRFSNDRPGKYTFRCDLHPNMKGEMYTLEIPTA